MTRSAATILARGTLAAMHGRSRDDVMTRARKAKGKHRAEWAAIARGFGRDVVKAKLAARERDEAQHDQRRAAMESGT